MEYGKSLVVSGNECVSAFTSSRDAELKEKFARIEFLFSMALEMPDAERDAWLLDECSDDEEVYHELLTLLQAHYDSGEFLSRPADMEAIVDPLVDLIGQRVGAYQVQQLLGKGGMGSVYLADRVDGEYEQQVAIKLITAHASDDPLIRRERQILADLNHPNIVHILDAGCLAESFSYFVMEYIDGQSIDHYWRTENVPLKTRIEQFAELTSIVHQAHIHGVIHCDLKPGNILVDQKEQLKLLDFGIAQLSDVQDESDKRYALTPEYSSPQRHQQKPPTIADDIFSLGVLFFCAITGEKPRILRAEGFLYPEPDIEKMSVLISHPELTQIFLQATHPVSAERYTSARAFCADLMNWLHCKPVEAVQGKLFYKLKKHVRRNWAYWLRGVIAFIMIGIALTIWLQKKVHENQNVQIQMGAEALLSELDYTLQTLPKTTLIQERLTAAAYQRISRLVDQHPDNTPIKVMQANILTRLAEVTGHPYALNKGDIKNALRYYEQAVKRYQQILPERTDALMAHVDIANTQRKIAEIKAYQGDIEGGLGAMQTIREEMERLFADVPVAHQLPLIIMYTVEAHGYFHQNDLAKAQMLIDKAWVIANSRHKASIDTHQLDIHQQLVFAFLQEETGHLALLKGNLVKAKQAYSAVINDYHQSNRWQHKLRLIRSHNGLACIALHEQQVNKAQQSFSEILETYAYLGEQYPNAEIIQQKLANFFPIISDEQPTAKQLWQYLQCDNPQQFMIPPQGKD
jgi:serine/threonine protein kinase